MSSMCDKVICLSKRHELEDKKLKLFTTLADVSTIDFDNASSREQALDQHQALSFLLAWATANSEAGQISNVEEVTANIENFTAKVGTYEKTLQSAADIVNDMRQLAVLCMDQAKSEEDRFNWDQKYQALADALGKIAGSAQYNGQPVCALTGPTFTALKEKYGHYYRNLQNVQMLKYAAADPAHTNNARRMQDNGSQWTTSTAANGSTMSDWSQAAFGSGASDAFNQGPYYSFHDLGADKVLVDLGTTYDAAKVNQIYCPRGDGAMKIKSRAYTNVLATADSAESNRKGNRVLSYVFNSTVAAWAHNNLVQNGMNDTVLTKAIKNGEGVAKEVFETVEDAAVANRATLAVCQRVKVRLMAATGLQDHQVGAGRYNTGTNGSNAIKLTEGEIKDVNTIFSFCFEPFDDETLGMKKFKHENARTKNWRGTLITSFDTARVAANQAGNAIKDIRERIYSARSAQQELQMIKESNISQYHHLIKTLERQREFAKNQINRELCNILKTISYLNACIRHNGD